MTKQKKPKTAQVKAMSVQEFQFWINGLSSFQEEGWHPNKAQWDHIKVLIDNLIMVAPAIQALPQQRQAFQPAQTIGGGEAVQIPMQPAQQRFLESPSGNGNGAKGKAELDEFGKPILGPTKFGQSEFT
jgi:hypothetical protein